MAYTDYATAILGWSVIGGVGAAIYLKYAGKTPARPVRVTKQHRALSNVGADPQRSRAEKSSNGANSSATSAATSGKSSKPKKNKPKTEQATRPASTSLKANNEDFKPEPKEDMSWVQELNARKQGTKLTNTSAQKQNRVKTVKQASANKVAEHLSAESSTADGADSASPRQSPDLPATESDVRVSGDINDMLEPAGPGPAALRITEPEKWIPAPKKSAPKAAPQVETKKQRQNKQRAEDRKALEAENEKARKAQLENQRRSARESRGEPAKNGLGSAPASNAWIEKPEKETHVANGNPMLDTFVEEHVTTTEAPSKEAALHGISDVNRGKSDHTNLPSEEEQIRRLAEEDDSAWATVKTKKSKRNNADADDGAVKPVNVKPAPQAAPVAKASKQSNGQYSVLANDDLDGWTVA